MVSTKLGFLGMTAVPLDAIDPTNYDRILVADLTHAEESERELEAAGVSPEMIVALFEAPTLPEADPDEPTTVEVEHA